MKRRPIMAGNWKMHMLVAEAESLVKALLAGLDGSEDVDVAVAPPFTSLYPVGKLLRGTSIGLAAQNLHWEPSGAYTGEVAAKMLVDVGCKYVIIGHSERRQYFGETDETVNRRLKAALSVGLEPILCVGEVLEERKAGRTWEVVGRQTRQALAGVSRGEAERLIIAYEPVWAIGTGETATPDQAQEVHGQIRGLIREIYDEGIAQGLRIQYGGSVKPDNVRGLMEQPDVDGALVGGASLKAASFLGIVKF
jgi:triosephosphate isomerase